MNPPDFLHRRDLFRLRPRSSAPSQSANVPQSVPEESSGSALLRAKRSAMGSFFEVVLPYSVPGAATLATSALDLIDDLELQMTIYRDDSELSRVNATAHEGPVRVERRLFSVLEQGLAISEATEGAYDISSGALSWAWGFIKGPKRLPDPEVLEVARAKSGWRHVGLDRENLTVSFDRPGMVLNLGSIGKGYAVDRAVELIRNHWWSTSALVHGGQSSIYALGSPPGQFAGRWEVALRDPYQSDRLLGTWRLRNRGLGTSGGTYQWLEHEGIRYSHIIDPRTGWPAPIEGSDPRAVSVTVLAPTAAEADAFSTAFSLLGPAQTADFLLKRRPDLGVLFVFPPTGSDSDPDSDSADSLPRILPLGLDEHDFVFHPQLAS